MDYLIVQILIITPLLLTIQYFIHIKRGQSHFGVISLAALGLSLLSLASFFIGYRFDPAVPGFKLFHPQYWQYAQLVFLYFAKFFGETEINLKAQLVGAGLFFGAFFILSWHIKKLLCDHPDEPIVSRTIVILIAFAMLFSLNMAFGRISLGLKAAQASRYVTFLIPAGLGVYLHILTLPQGRLTASPAPHGVPHKPVRRVHG